MSATQSDTRLADCRASAASRQHGLLEVQIVSSTTHCSIYKREADDNIRNILSVKGICLCRSAFDPVPSHYKKL